MIFENLFGKKNSAGVTINVESDGIRLTKARNGARHGDILLVSYQTNSEEWQRIVVEFQDEAGGMFIYTGREPSNVVIVRERDAEKARELKDVPRAVYHSERYRSSNLNDGWDLTDPTNLFNPLNPFSPFYMFRVDSYYGWRDDFYQQWEIPTGTSHGPSVSADSDSQFSHPVLPGTNAGMDTTFGANPFDPKAVDVGPGTLGDSETRSDSLGTESPDGRDSLSYPSSDSLESAHSSDYSSEPNAY